MILTKKFEPIYSTPTIGPYYVSEVFGNLNGWLNVNGIFLPKRKYDMYQRDEKRCENGFGYYIRVTYRHSWLLCLARCCVKVDFAKVHFPKKCLLLIALPQSNFARRFYRSIRQFQNIFYRKIAVRTKQISGKIILISKVLINKCDK